MITLTPETTKTYKFLAKCLKKGHYRIVSSEFMDWLMEHDPDLSEEIRTIPNPDRVGVLDEFVAFTKPDGFYVKVPGILKGFDGKMGDASLKCDRMKKSDARDIDALYGFWFYGFANQQSWKVNLTYDEILRMIASKEVILQFHQLKEREEP